MKVKIALLNSTSTREIAVGFPESTALGSDARAEVVLTQPGVLDFHAELFQKGGNVWIRPIDPAMVVHKGQRVKRSGVRLRPRDVVQLGGVAFTVLEIFDAEKRSPTSVATDLADARAAQSPRVGRSGSRPRRIMRISQIPILGYLELLDGSGKFHSWLSRRDQQHVLAYYLCEVLPSLSPNRPQPPRGRFMTFLAGPEKEAFNCPECHANVVPPYLQYSRQGICTIARFFDNGHVPLPDANEALASLQGVSQVHVTDFDFCHKCSAWLSWGTRTFPWGVRDMYKMSCTETLLGHWFCLSVSDMDHLAQSWLEHTGLDFDGIRRWFEMRRNRLRNQGALTRDLAECLDVALALVDAFTLGSPDAHIELGRGDECEDEDDED